MKKKQIIGLVVAAALFVGVSAASVFTNIISKNLLQSSADDIINLGGSYQFNPPSEDYCNRKSRRYDPGTEWKQYTGGIQRISA